MRVGEMKGRFVIRFLIVIAIVLAVVTMLLVLHTWLLDVGRIVEFSGRVLWID